MCYREQIVKARSAQRFGIILGTLGRQGSPAMFQHARGLLQKHGKQCVLFLMAEIQPQKLQLLKQIDVRLQNAIFCSCTALLTAELL